MIMEIVETALAYHNHRFYSKKGGRQTTGLDRSIE